MKTSQELFDELKAALIAEIREEERANARAAVIAELQGGTAPNVKAKTGPKPMAKRSKGAKRDPGDIEALTEQLFAAMKKAPNSRIEELSKELGMATKELALPVKRLLDSKRVKKSGQRRATRYTAK
jgi:hypothetical protein